ncbi:glycosyltransferase family 2 protein [Acinetobacter lwoffii]|uniref:glycosyltransferase family 2 protein n=1 Tax=Acinetobacter lwoffii TaxID=28090 RepID=UPI00209A9937|nr:glycosyltransferase family 2 protein [Acinetobacter lwoffii]MCO8074281.1 glycosyltransferase family 2 protein [Acinetobacter lwoffii]MCO8077236.1 glycosyltransferase family 2 protein [Acinetobacter lwoffii]
MDISILIVNYNTKELILNCLQSIYEHTKDIDFEVIVIDNNSHDGSIDAIKNYFKNVNIINSGSNLGFGGANNLGCDYARSDYLFFLNSDTLLIENSIKFLLDKYKELEKNNRIGTLGAILVDEKGNITTSGGKVPTVWQFISMHFMKIVPKNIKKANQDYIKSQLSKVEMVSGADMVIKKELFKELNGFDENFFLYYEDTDLHKRLLDLGYINYLDCTTRIMHYEGGSAEMSHWKRTVIHTSQNYFFRKHSTLFLFIVYSIYQLLFSIFSLLNGKYTFKQNIDFIKTNLKNFKL